MRASAKKELQWKGKTWAEWSSGVLNCQMCPPPPVSGPLWTTASWQAEGTGLATEDPIIVAASSSSPRYTSDLEQARPQTSGEEELQLQLALAMSREEAEKVRTPSPGRAGLGWRGGKKSLGTS